MDPRARREAAAPERVRERWEEQKNIGGTFKIRRRAPPLIKPAVGKLCISEQQLRKM